MPLLLPVNILHQEWEEKYFRSQIRRKRWIYNYLKINSWEAVLPVWDPYIRSPKLSLNGEDWLGLHFFVCLLTLYEKLRGGGLRVLGAILYNQQAWASLVAYMIKSLPAMQERRVQFRGLEDLLEKEMATHSSILAWRIPWTEEPGGL